MGQKNKDVLYPLRVFHGWLHQRLTINKKEEPLTIDKWPIEKRVEGAMNLYEKSCGYRFDINNPETFTEKIIWYKIYYNNPILTRIVDKYRFKEYIHEKLGGDEYTLPIYGAYTSIQELKKDWQNLPREFMLKSNLQSDGLCIKHIPDKDAVDLEKLFSELSGWLDVRRTLINSFCRAYYGATPRIIAEKYAENVAGQLFDYKAYCFRGNPYCFCASVNHFGEAHYPITYYDCDWNKIDVRSGIHKNDDIPQPPHLDEMISISKVLSSDFPFVRVDFFDTTDQLYLGELTFYPGGGQYQYDPPSFNKTLGDLFILPKSDTEG